SWRRARSRQQRAPARRVEPNTSLLPTDSRSVDTAVLKDVLRLAETHWRLRSVLYASARVELKKRYAGSLLGPAWTVLYPLLFLGVYLFLWLVVFRVRFSESTTALDYVVFVFGGLVP